jgi:hypothetical protein
MYGWLSRCSYTRPQRSSSVNSREQSQHTIFMELGNAKLARLDSRFLRLVTASRVPRVFPTLVKTRVQNAHEMTVDQWPSKLLDSRWSWPGARSAVAKLCRGGLTGTRPITPHVHLMLPAAHPSRRTTGKLAHSGSFRLIPPFLGLFVCDGEWHVVCACRRRWVK